MAIARFENIDVNTLSFGASTFGEQSTSQTKWFTTRARVQSVANHVKISEKYRVYSDVVNFTLNYTPNLKTIIDNQNAYSITWRSFSWRIDNVRESDDRMTAMLLCVRNDPVVAV
ncbi:hypothetical protein UFOVP815_25 [uncultured Caudovirales phage]|jgi:hypothetical protein|uniref:Bacteriophage SPP1, head-tail adaptor n=1 Tax=uncultured Caudovirales phage TaxID=2100421 RepID=A0A6J5P849_9CAUD|nr:hypothetical protein UFOVP815_25 [uncultured Caudovirales phage]